MRVWDSRMLRLQGAITAVALAYFAAEVAFGELVPSLVDWLLVFVTTLPAALACLRIGRSPVLSEAAGRYWRLSAYALVIIGSSMLFRAFGTDIAAEVVHGSGVALMLWALFRLPIARRSRHDRLALALDAATMMAAAAIFLWHTAVLQTLSAEGVTLASVVTVAGMMAAGLIGIFLVVKVALTGSEALSRGALQMIALGAAFGGLGAAVSTALVGRPDVNTFLLIGPTAALFTAIGARRQLVDTVREAGRRARPRRRYSVLLYVAVAAVDGLLIHVLIHNTADRILVAVVAILLTGLVIFRQVQAFRENDTNEQRFRLLVQNSTDIITISDLTGDIRYVSPSIHHVLGLDADQFAGTRMGGRAHPDDRPGMLVAVDEVRATPGASATYQARIQHADGSWRWMELTSANLTHEPSVRGIVTNARDITETRQVQDRLTHEATHDNLTGLPNRALFGRRISDTVSRTEADHRFSVVLVDLDDFKIVNDTLGHAAGDALLVAVGERMRANVRPTDTVARLGGDEFAILLEGATAGHADTVLARIAEALAVPVEVGEHLLGIKASFGVVAGEAGGDPEELMQHADIAMYESKDAGDGRRVHYRPGMTIRRPTAELR